MTRRSSGLDRSSGRTSHRRRRLSRHRGFQRPRVGGRYEPPVHLAADELLRGWCEAACSGQAAVADPEETGMRSLGRALLLLVLLPVSNVMLRLTGRLCRFTLRLAREGGLARTYL